MRKCLLSLVLLAVFGCADAMPSPKTVGTLSSYEDKVCGVGLALLPPSPERDKLEALCEVHADAKELAEAYAQCPGAH
jgi:hypothetical protein